jgi:hypothetical protein
MLVKTKAKFLYYNGSRKDKDDVFEMADKDIKDFDYAVELVQVTAQKRGRPKKVEHENTREIP